MDLGSEQLARSCERSDARRYIDGRSEDVACPADDRPVMQPRPRQRQSRFVPASLQQHSKRLDGEFRLGKRQHRLVADPFDRRPVPLESLADHALENLQNSDRRLIAEDVGDGAESARSTNATLADALAKSGYRCPSRRASKSGCSPGRLAGAGRRKIVRRPTSNHVQIPDPPPVGRSISISAPDDSVANAGAPGRRTRRSPRTVFIPCGESGQARSRPAVGRQASRMFETHWLDGTKRPREALGPGCTINDAVGRTRKLIKQEQMQLRFSYRRPPPSPFVRLPLRRSQRNCPLSGNGIAASRRSSLPLKTTTTAPRTSPSRKSRKDRRLLYRVPGGRLYDHAFGLSPAMRWGGSHRAARASNAGARMS